MSYCRSSLCRGAVSGRGWSHTGRSSGQIEVAMSNNDLDYYRRRADEEARRAAAASEKSIAGIHRVLAENYKALLDEMGGEHSSGTSNLERMGEG